MTRRSWWSSLGGRSLAAIRNDIRIPGPLARVSAASDPPPAVRATDEEQAAALRLAALAVGAVDEIR